MLRSALALALVFVVTGCGGTTDGKSRPVAAQLRVTVWSQGKTGLSVTRTLDCPSGTGTFPAARSTCTELSRLDTSVFAPVPAGTACTMIYGGRQIARVTGTLAGEAIDATFNRSNGCEIARWQRLGFLFGPAPI
jgi:hypothetical protein